MGAQLLSNIFCTLAPNQMCGILVLFATLSLSVRCSVFQNPSSSLGCPSGTSFERGQGLTRRGGLRRPELTGCLWEVILHACNYTSLIDNAEKPHWFGVSWRSAAAWPLITPQFCNVRLGFRRCISGKDAAAGITPEEFAFHSTGFSSETSGINRHIMEM